MLIWYQALNKTHLLFIVFFYIATVHYYFQSQRIQSFKCEFFSKHKTSQWCFYKESPHFPENTLVSCVAVTNFS